MMTPSAERPKTFQQTYCNSLSSSSLSLCEIPGHADKRKCSGVTFTRASTCSPVLTPWSVASAASRLRIKKRTRFLLIQTVWISWRKTSQCASSRRVEEAVKRSRPSPPRWSHRWFSDFVSLILWLCLCLTKGCRWKARRFHVCIWSVLDPVWDNLGVFTVDGSWWPVHLRGPVWLILQLD